LNERLFAIEAKRARLIERAAHERENLRLALHALSRPLGFVDRCLGAVRYAVARPALLAGVMLVLALLHPRRAFKWAQRAFGLWQSYRWLTKKAVS
jgi:hypothetical protein